MTNRQALDVIKPHARVAAALAAVTLLLSCLACGKVHYVDQAPFAAYAQAYFDKLKTGDTAGALAMYSPEFIGQNREIWTSLLTQL